jgi:hypothetical protein
MFVAVVTSGLLILVLIASMLPSIITNLGNFFAHDNFCKNVQSRAINSSFQNLVRLSQIKNVSLPDYARVNKV